MARRIERVSDQAKNICEEVLYMCTGEYAKHRKEEAYRIVFVDQSNDCLSQMAEAIAAELRAESFIFSSSGLEPRPVSARLIRFLKGKGIDWSTAKSKTLDQVPNLDHYQIYIALSPEGRSVFPVPPTKAVGFEWVVPDPMSQPENQSDNDTVYEAAYQALDEHLRELIEAILGEPLE
jgi:protein-tyrosine-phosphatase